MNVGFIGLGKLGLPVALTIESHGHNLVGYDIDSKINGYIKNRKIPYVEEGTDELLKKTKLEFLKSTQDVIEASEIVFVPVQTPHDPMYEGITRLPKTRKNFETKYLKEAISEIVEATETLDKKIILVIISTVLPGTIREEIMPILNDKVDLIYNPYFIAMGTTRHDFENPEFVLLGYDSDKALQKVKELYHTIHDKPFMETTIESAELIKVLYNTYISQKIAFINTAMEICEKTGANVDEITRAISMANQRLISTRYLKGGMGDGGGCHPRDNIALSWLARKHNLSFDLFEAVMLSRERQNDWFADLIEKTRRGLDVFILGYTFKKNINLTVGSPAILLSNILKERGIHHSLMDPYVDAKSPIKRGLYFIGVDHDIFKKTKFPKGSIVIDPWGIIEDQADIIVKRVGRQ